MSHALTEAANRLAVLLESENEALRRGEAHDVGAATREKQEAAEAVAALLGGSPRAGDPQNGNEARATVTRLRVAAAENQKLLARALEVQERLIGIVASAGMRARAMPRYGANGNLATSRVTSSFALSAQA